MDSATNRESITKAFYRGTRPSARTSAPGLRAAQSRTTSSPYRCSRASRPGPCHSAHFEVCAACPAGSSRSSRGFQRRLHAAGRAPSCSCRRRSDIETPAGWHSTVPCTRLCPRPLPLRTQFLTLFDCFGPETARVLQLVDLRSLRGMYIPELASGLQPWGPWLNDLLKLWFQTSRCGSLRFAGVIVPGPNIVGVPSGAMAACPQRFAGILRRMQPRCQRCWQRTPPEPPRIIASPWRSQGPAHPGEE